MATGLVMLIDMSLLAWVMWRVEKVTFVDTILSEH